MSTVSPSWPARSEVLLGEFTIARSGLPSALTSPIATLNGESPHGNGEPAGWQIPHAVAEENGDVVSLEIRAYDVRFAIAVQIGDTDSLVRVLASTNVSPRRLEVALAIADEDDQAILCQLSVTRSRLPSPLKSPVGMPWGCGLSSDDQRRSWLGEEFHRGRRRAAP